ncbi:unnamed protein product [Cyprideis torosa]|uniref:Uncharacterized protein n=1 Tax=Cyprideis torosa TaxID=163714 RepID=A0A7R9A1N0_9CRUS|nr:unnamed protein product [Cyprideis torosa]CAG0912117.1 unnamed protein product [Cyprideis torosa]
MKRRRRMRAGEVEPKKLLPQRKLMTAKTRR